VKTAIPANFRPSALNLDPPQKKKKKNFIRIDISETTGIDICATILGKWVSQRELIFFRLKENSTR
jgi:hypothetical protein